METKETVRATPRERDGKTARGDDCGCGCGQRSSPVNSTGWERDTETKEPTRASVNDGDGRTDRESDCGCGCGLGHVGSEQAA